LGSGYVINFYFDRQIDKLNPIRKDLDMSSQPFSTGEIGLIGGMSLALTLLLLGLALAWLISSEFFTLALSSWLVGLLYSAPPIRLKARPFLDVLSNSVSCGYLCYTAGWTIGRNLSEMPLLLPVWLSVFVAPTYILTLLIDNEADSLAGVRTTVAYLGIPRSLRLGHVLLCTSYLMLAAAQVIVGIRFLHLVLLSVFYPLGVLGYRKLLTRFTLEGARKLGKRAVQSSVLFICLALFHFLA